MARRAARALRAAATRMADTEAGPADGIGETAGELKAVPLTGNRDMAEDLERVPCGTCKRSFAPSVLARHEPICRERAAKELARKEAAGKGAEAS